MKKNKEWLREEINKEIENIDYPLRYSTNEYNTRMSMIEVFKRKVDQLDEPELPVIPQFVADWIKECKVYEHNLFGVYQFSPEVVSDWIFENESKKERVDLIARAWLYDYRVETSNLYNVLDKNGRSILYHFSYDDGTHQWEKVISHGDYNDGDGADYKKIEKEGHGTLSHSLTESQINEYDERYWAFAEEVPNE